MVSLHRAWLSSVLEGICGGSAASRLLGVPYTWVLPQARAGRIPHHRLTRRGCPVIFRAGRTAAVRARDAPLLKNVAMHFVERRPG
jgi:hypothetical protein